MSASPTVILPGGTLGVLGGGQLGRMFVHAAQAMGYRTIVLDPDPTSPAGLVAHEHLCAPYTDPEALAALAERADAVTTEFENVDAAALRWLAERIPVAPGSDALLTCQDRGREKAAIEACGIPAAPHAVIEQASDLAGTDHLLPGILKTAGLGYDGKGQVRVSTAAELADGWRSLGEVRCVLEQRLALAYEVSVIVARAAGGESVALPPQENVHRDGILAVTTVPAPSATPQVQEEAIEAATRIADALGYVGVLCVEFFVLEDGTLVANEMAPRPHNSGHYSIEACSLSQFALQVRTLAGLPLGQPELVRPAQMLNLLGDLWFDGDAGAPREPNWPAVLALPGTSLHLYGKTEPRHARKMGHLTITGADAAQVARTAQQAAALLGLG